MAIKIMQDVINTQDYDLGNRVVKAVYTPEVDEQYGDVLIHLEEISRKADSKEVDDMNVADKKKFLHDTNKEIKELAVGYIKALFSSDDAKAILEATGGRVVNLTRLVGIFHENGDEKKVLKNRKQRRHEDK